MVYVFLAEGFEELEATAPIDILLRGGVDVKTVGVTGKRVKSTHGIEYTADIEIGEAVTENLEAVILPGGMPGTANLEKSAAVQKFIDFAAQNGKLVCAICAAPMILGHKGLLAGKKAICYPGVEPQLEGATITAAQAVTDGKFITGRGPGAAAEFGFAVLKELKGESTVKAVFDEMCFA